MRVYYAKGKFPDYDRTPIASSIQPTNDDLYDAITIARRDAESSAKRIIKQIATLTDILHAQLQQIDAMRRDISAHHTQGNSKTRDISADILSPEEVRMQAAERELKSYERNR